MSERINEDYAKYYDIIEEVEYYGAFGRVYKGKKKDTNELRAIKIINYDRILTNLSYEYTPDKIEEQLQICIKGFIKEYEIMKILSKNNKYSIKCYEYFNNKDKFVIIMELWDINLSELLSKRIREDKTCFNIDEILEIMNQLNNTFKIMKENNIILRDLKLENILVKYNDNKEYIIKLADYCASESLNSLSKLNSTKIGTTLHMAPEILYMIINVIYGVKV